MQSVSEKEGEDMSNGKGAIHIVGSMVGLSAGIVNAIRQAEKAGIEVVVIPETPNSPALDLAGCLYEFRPNAPVPFLETCKNEPWRNRPKREKYRK